MSNTPEIKSFEDFETALEEKGAAAKEKLVQLKEAADDQKLLILQNFLADFTIAKTAEGYVMLKNKYDQSEYRVASEKALNEIFHDTLNGTNELKVNEALHEIRIETVTTTTKQDAANLHKEVTAETFNFPTFGNLTLLQAAYASHPEYAEERMTTREEKKLRRKTERLQNARSDRARRRISGKIDKTAEKIADRRADTNKHMTNAAENYVFAEELEHQSWYYNDVIHALTEAQESNRVHYMDEFVYIDTYHPLFRNTTNFKGTIRLSRAAVASYEFNREFKDGKERKLTAAEIQRKLDHPEDTEAIDKGGILGGVSNWLVEHTNMTPQQAENFRAASKLGAAIGLGVLGWMTLKRIFNIGKKYDAGERRGRGLGAAAILVGVPALTGKGVWDLLTTGSSKDAWDKMKGLLDKNGIHVENPFASTDRKVIFPALGNRMFGTMTLEDYSRYVTKDKSGKYVLNVDGMRLYLQNNLELAGNDPEKLQRAQEQIAIFEESVRQNKIQIITDSHATSLQLDKVTNKNQSCEALYKAYIDGQTLTADILGGDKKLRIKDQKALEDYLHEQIVDKHRDPSSITKDELLKAGLLVEAAPGTDANQQKTGYEQFKDDVNEAAEDVSTWTKDTWKSVKASVAAAGATVGGWLGLQKKPEDADLAAQRQQLAELEAKLAKLEKMDAVKRDKVATLEEIHEVQNQIKDANHKIDQLETIEKQIIDPELEPLVKNKMLTEEAAKALTEAKNDLNIQYELINRNRADAMMKFTVQNGKLYLSSYSTQIPVTYKQTPDKKSYIGTLSDCPLQFHSAKSLLQTANFVNFLEQNYKYSSKEEKPFYNDGSEISMRGPGIDKDMLESLYDDIDGVRTKQFVDWLNNIKGAMGISIWLEGAKPNNDVIATKQELETTAIEQQGYAAFSPVMVGQYEGKKIPLADPASFTKNALGQTIYGKIEAAFDGKGLVYKTHGRETAILKNGNERKVANFKYSFETAKEAIYVANFINYCKKYYEYASTGTEPFNISMTGKYLEFAQHSDKEFRSLRKGIAFDIKNDARVATASELAKLSPIFNNEKIREEFAKFLNKGYDKWHA